MCPRVEYDVGMLALLVAIGLASGSAGAVRIPSSGGAWGGIREEGPERVADYELEAVLDPVRHTVEGKERLSWKNRSAGPISSLYVHLYLNAFEGPGSTFAQEKVRYGGFHTGDAPSRKGEWGYIDLEAVTQSGQPVPWAFVHPDGGPDTDRTVARLDLPQPVAPGGTAVLEMEFHDQLPRVVARTGWFDSYHLVAQWFPKLGVLELPGERGATEPRWNCHEFHLNSEFYADFGSYRATLTVPRGYVVGSVGAEVAPPEEAPGESVRYRIAQDDVHDFAFTAWNGFQLLEGDFRPEASGAPDVHIKVLHPKEYGKAARLALDATRDALGYFSRTLGPYPYRQVTVVVPPYNATASSGMEYETFFTTIGALGPPLLDVVRFVTVHEFGHGYFMGLLASNEFEEPFLDEGLNEFWDARMLEKTPLRLSAPGVPGKLGLRTPDFDWFDLERTGTRRFQADPIAGNSWDRWSRGSYGLVYSRTALVFHDLEQRLGGDVLARGFREYYRRWRFRHPSSADLEDALAEVGGPGVRQWFAEQVYASAPVDDRVETIETREKVPEPGTSVQPDGSRVHLDEAQAREQERAAREAFRKAHPGAKAGAPGPFAWESVVQARRYAAHVPQRVTFRFEGGDAETVEWPVEERWHRWVFDKPVRISSVQLDPERKILLDLDKLDDGRTRERAPLASRRWGLEVEAWATVALSLLEAL